MSSYNEAFKLSTKDIALIEEAIREQIDGLVRLNLMEGDSRERSRQITEREVLLGKLSNQKIWYGGVHHTGVPLG